MKVCDLKIKAYLWELIKRGEKRFEIRRSNKNYIDRGDLILYRDINNLHIFGFAKVKSRFIDTDTAIINGATEVNYSPRTVDFVKQNYNGIGWLLVLEVEPLDWRH